LSGITDALWTDDFVDEGETYLLEFRPSDPGRWLGVNDGVALEYRSNSVILFLTLLQFDVGKPCSLGRFPLHPSFENLART